MNAEYLTNTRYFHGKKRLIVEVSTLPPVILRCFENKHVVGLFPLPLSSVALASAPHPLLGAEVRGSDKTRGNPLFVESRSGDLGL